PIDRAPGRDVPTTPRLSRVLTLTVEEAAGFGQPHADTEHLLLGLLREPEGVAAEVLAALGVTLEAARAEVARRCGCEYRGGLVQADLPAPAPAPLPVAAPRANRFRLRGAAAGEPTALDDRVRELERAFWEQQVFLGALAGLLAGLAGAALY